MIELFVAMRDSVHKIKLGQFMTSKATSFSISATVLSTLFTASPSTGG